MKDITLLKAGIRQHKGMMLGIFTIVLMAALFFLSVVSIWLNANTYLKEELERMHFGDISAWTREIPNAKVYEDIIQLPDTASITRQALIYSDYEIFDQHSDSEGQLIVYEPETFPYRIFNEQMNGYQKETMIIPSGDIYVSSVVLASMQAQIGDWISFPIARAGNVMTFQIAGAFEDPFMGSSMIGMKSFLISQEDYEQIHQRIEAAGIDALARTGELVHIEQSEQSSLTNAQFNQQLNEQTSLGDYVEFMYSKDTITGFMLILQNAFAGLSFVFALILLLIAMIMVGYSVGTTIEQDAHDLGILKTIGYEGSRLRRVLMRQYLLVILAGLLVGTLLSCMVTPLITTRMVSFAGILAPSTPPLFIWLILLVFVIICFFLFLNVKTKRIQHIPPLHILQDVEDLKEASISISIQKRMLVTRISMRQLCSEKKRYISVCSTAFLLVFILSMITRMDAWLGPDGKGMMDAFNPADLDIGVQLIGNHEQREVEALIEQFTSITDSYALAMPNISLEGVDYTANVITEPERFHILAGRTSEAANEIVITETIAKDMELSLHDQVRVSYNGISADYSIVGIYQCANDMGGNIGMRRSGFQRIAQETPSMWCYHYFLADPAQKQSMIKAINERYGGDVYIHENTWPGLYSIIMGMQLLLLAMYVLTALFILIVTVMTGYKLYLFEKRNLSIYKAIGFPSFLLRATFAIRYGICAVLGSCIGMIASIAWSDKIVSALMRLCGIANYAASPSLLAMVFPAIVVTLLFSMFAYLTSRRIKGLDIHTLIEE